MTTDDADNRPMFDSNFSPKAPVNQRAAKAHNLRYDAKRKAYVDSDGALVRDRFGQHY